MARTYLAEHAYGAPPMDTLFRRGFYDRGRAESVAAGWAQGRGLDAFTHVIAYEDGEEVGRRVLGPQGWTISGTYP